MAEKWLASPLQLEQKSAQNLRLLFGKPQQALYRKNLLLQFPFVGVWDAAEVLEWVQ
jgi:hypothetical protein